MENYTFKIWGALRGIVYWLKMCILRNLLHYFIYFYESKLIKCIPFVAKF